MNNRNYACTTCRTVTRKWFALCRVCGAEMRRVNHPPKRDDDAAWARLAAELRERDEYVAKRDWLHFVANCPVR